MKTNNRQEMDICIYENLLNNLNGFVNDEKKDGIFKNYA